MTHAADKKPSAAPALRRVSHEPPSVPVAGARLTWLGHSTVLIDLDGVRLITDPVLRGHVLHLRRTAPPVGALGHLDAALVSHAHWDHLDRRSLAQLGRSLPVVLPTGAARLLRRHGFARLVELDVGDETAFGRVRIRAVPAKHDVSRGPIGLRTPALGFVISGSRTIYFAGDTDLFAAMGELSDRIDAALLPVAGWGPSLPAGHLDPERAAKAVVLLRPAVAIPIHWGTLAPFGRRRPSEEPGTAFARAVAALDSDADVRVLAVGDSTSL